MPSTLEQLTRDNLVFLFGAGASRDYGFPTWPELHGLLLTEMTETTKTTGSTNVQKKLAEIWIDRLNTAENDVKNGAKTIDSIVAEQSTTDVERNFIVEIIERILYVAENRDHNVSIQAGNNSIADPNTKKWVHKLSVGFLEILESLSQENLDSGTIQLFKNVKFVSLNYERCFAYQFFIPISEFLSLKRFSDRHFLSNQEQVIRSFFTVQQPHGSFGSLELPNVPTGNPAHRVHSENGTRRYGYRPGNMGRSYGHHVQDSGIQLIGEWDMTKNYELINEQIIEPDSTCIVLGCSAAGINGTEIDWQKFRKIYYCSKSDSFPLAIPTVEQKELYADELVSYLLS